MKATPGRDAGLDLSALGIWTPFTSEEKEQPGQGLAACRCANLPLVHMGDASAYSAVLRSIENDLAALLSTNPTMFTFGVPNAGLVSVRDFQTAGVVAFARGCPFYNMPTGRIDIGGRRVRLEQDQKNNCVDALEKVVAML